MSIAQDDFDQIAISFREEQPEDREANQKLHQEALGSDAEANLVDALREGGDGKIS